MAPRVHRRPAHAGVETVQSGVAPHAHDVDALAISAEAEMPNEHRTDAGHHESRRTHAAEEVDVRSGDVEWLEAARDRQRAQFQTPAPMPREQGRLVLLAEVAVVPIDVQVAAVDAAVGEKLSADTRRHAKTIGNFLLRVAPSRTRGADEGDPRSWCGKDRHASVRHGSKVPA